mgnify:CR=1 FL=1
MKQNKFLVILLLVGVIFYHHHHKSNSVIIDNQPEVIEPIAPVEPIVPDESEDKNNCDIALKEAVKTDKKLLIIFTAEWCGFCRTLKKDLPNLDTSDYKICTINIDDKNQSNLVSHFNIKIVPTTIMVDPDSNKEIKRISGYISDKYKSWLKE